jgi:hypothetical protein
MGCCARVRAQLAPLLFMFALTNAPCLLDELVDALVDDYQDEPEAAPPPLEVDA